MEILRRFFYKIGTEQLEKCLKKKRIRKFLKQKVEKMYGETKSKGKVDKKKMI